MKITRDDHNEFTGRISIFNPHRLTDAQLINSFIARQELFRAIMADIVGGRPKSVPQHHLIVGQRGMGKTTLLRRIAAELRSKTHCEQFVPLTFPEEQYVEVDRLSKLWLNCLDALADALEQEGHSTHVQAIDKTVHELEKLKVDELTCEEECRNAFDSAWRAIERRPVLMIDNFNLLLDRCSDKDHALRGYFTRAGAPILVTAATVYPEQLDDYGAAFYDGFKPHSLHPLDIREIREVHHTVGPHVR